MLDVVKRLPEQIEEALKIKTDFVFEGIKNVAVSAMGGSAISGDIVQHFSKLPFFIIRDYYLPPYIGKDTLFIAISYSGNTEETLACFKEALKRNCKTIAITSNGMLADEAENKILIPSGMQPRAAIAYLLFPLINLLRRNGIVSINCEEALYLLKSERNKIEELARKIAYEIKGFPIIYGYGILASIAKRWRQQFNENSKMMAFDFALPECNHNEIEAWEGIVEGVTCIFLRGVENERVKIRFDFMKKIYSKKAKVIEVHAYGKDDFSKAMYALFLGDLASVYMAERNGVDAEPVNLIKKLKEELQHSRSSS